jgi:hypothetical protein
MALRRPRTYKDNHDAGHASAASTWTTADAVKSSTPMSAPLEWNVRVQ